MKKIVTSLAIIIMIICSLPIRVNATINLDKTLYLNREPRMNFDISKKEYVVIDLRDLNGENFEKSSLYVQNKEGKYVKVEDIGKNGSYYFDKDKVIIMPKIFENTSEKYYQEVTTKGISMNFKIVMKDASKYSCTLTEKFTLRKLNTETKGNYYYVNRSPRITIFQLDDDKINFNIRDKSGIAQAYITTADSKKTPIVYLYAAGSKTERNTAENIVMTMKDFVEKAQDAKMSGTTDKYKIRVVTKDITGKVAVRTMILKIKIK